MSANSAAGRRELRAIARRAMTERRLLPEFSAAVLTQTQALDEGVAEAGPGIRDLRDHAGASIDGPRPLRPPQLSHGVLGSIELKSWLVSRSFSSMLCACPGSAAAGPGAPV